MKLMFIDEIEKNDYFGVCMVIIDASRYRKISKLINKKVKDSGWNHIHEFKSTCLFSAKTGDENMPIEKRKELITEIIKVNTTNKTSNVKGYFAYKKGRMSKTSYNELLCVLFSKIPKTREKLRDKNLMGIFYDDVTVDSIPLSKIIIPLTSTLLSRGYHLVEYPCAVKSSNSTIGVFLSDHMGSICLWTELNNLEEVIGTKKMKVEFMNKLKDSIRKIEIFKLDK